MAHNPIDINKTVQDVEHLLAKSDDVPPALEAAIHMLLTVVKLLADRAGLNSRNSSKPPASDPNREKKSRSKNAKPAGGQQGHVGTNLQRVDDPDAIKHIDIDRRTLPRGNYVDRGYESRQRFDIRISRHVTEYRAQVLENERGKRFVAPFPPELSKATQYGASVKANAVYMSMFQLIPYERIQTHFAEVFDMPLSAGSLYNFNADAYQRLELFETLNKVQLRQAAGALHVDETGINVDGKRLWLHNASNDQWTYIAPHAKWSGQAFCDNPVKLLFSVQKRLIRNRSGSCDPA
ncbi:DUF6444 domain-containing protein [Saccharospirillum impatiens]|uniref:DUF6444 domain-containing protein n=1 Tax=Saccharospirillum impatiens TaxID=169438 RepID=UPI000415415E|nr:transposase [Saccharospirillum impatiens]